MNVFHDNDRNSCSRRQLLQEASKKLESILSLRNLAAALIVALVYELVYKAAHLVVPAIFSYQSITAITTLLSALVGVTAILFIYLFLQAEKSNRALTAVLLLLIGCMLVGVVLRLPLTRNAFDFADSRLIQEVAGLVKSFLLVCASALYLRQVDFQYRSLKRATILLTIFFGLGLLKSVFSLKSYLHFLGSGALTDTPGPLLAVMFMMFLMGHLATIYFLYQYRLVQSTRA